MENDDTIQTLVIAVSIVAAFAVVAIYIWRLRIGEEKEKKLDKKSEEKRQKQIQSGVERGICDDEGNAFCVVCRELGVNREATEYTVVTGRPPNDDKPHVSQERELWAQPDRYMVVDAEDRGYRLCITHRQMVFRRQSAFHGGLRAEHSDFNAEIREKIDFMDNGGTERLVVEAAQKIENTLLARSRSPQAPPQIPSTTDQIALAPVTSGSIEKVEE